METLLKDLGIDHVVVLDTETYYDADYSLRKLSTTDYIRSGLFELQSIAFAEGNAEIECYNKNEHDLTAILTQFTERFPPERTAIICHNTAFDGAVLNYHFGYNPRFLFDTLSMARAMFPHNMGVSLNEVARRLGLGAKIAGALNDVKGLREIPPDLMDKLVTYNIQDTALCRDIFNDLIQGFPINELKLIDLTLKLYTDPKFVGDTKLAQDEYNREVAAKQRLFRSLCQSLDTDEKGVLKLLSSNPKFTQLLEDQGVEVPYKWSVKQDKWVPALAKNDLGFQELCEHPDEYIRLLCEARLSAKSTIVETRAQRFIRYASTGPIPVFLKMYGAHTQRWSGGDKFNPQNFPRTSLLRQALRAPAGYKLIVIDSAQIEARVLAYLAGQDDLLAQFIDPDQDPYCTMASIIYGFEVIKDVHDAERFVGKVAVLGLGFGMGALKYKNTLASGMMGDKVVITEAEAERAKQIYRERNRKIVEFWWDLEHIFGLMVQGYTTEKYGMVFEPDAVLMPNGLYVQYPNLRGTVNPYSGKIGDFTYDSRNGPTKLYGGKIAENLVQSYARSVVADQILRVSEKYRVLLAVHDEGVFLIPENELVTAEPFIMDNFRTPPEWAQGIPLDAELKTADYYCK